MAVAEPQVDYDALAEQVRKIKPAPTADVDYDALAAQVRGKKVDAAPAPDFTSNPKGERLYRMGSYDFHEGQVSKPEIRVPYSKVSSAQRAGYNLHPDEEPRYQKDSTHEGQGPTLWEKTKSTLQSETEPLPDVPLAEVDPKHPIASRWQRLNEAAQNVEQMPWNALTSGLRTVAGLKDMPEQAYDIAKMVHEGDPEAITRLEEFTPHKMAANILQSYKEDYKEFGPMAATSRLVGSIGAMYAAGKAGDRVVEGAPKVAKEAIAKSADAATKVAKDTFGIRPKVAADVVDKTIKDNKEAAKDYWDETHAAVKETGEREDVATAETRGNQMTVDEKYEADLKAVREKNNRKRAQHREEVAQIDKDVEAAKDALKKRQQIEEKIKTKTAETFEADERERVAAKDEENAAWKPWRDVAAKFRKPADTIVAAIKKYGVNTTELHRLLHDMKANPEDEPETSRYYLDRQWATDQMKLPNHPKYSELSLVEKARVNDWMDRIGVRPPAVSIDLDDGASVSLDEVHRAKSVLRRHANEMRRSGKLPEAGELDQVANVLTDTETDWSREAGVYDELMHAKTATANYQETFGREISEPKTKIGEAEKTTNPDFLKEQEEEAQLSQITKRNPELSKAHEKIRAMREELETMDSEERLRKVINAERPEPPTVGDLRGGKYELETEPKHPGNVPPVESTPKARPGIPDAIQAGEEDLTEANRKQYQSTVDRLRHKGIYIASTGIGLVTSGLLHALVKMNFPAIVTDVIGGSVATALSVVGLNKIADMLESPGAREWFAKPTEAQMKELDKLPEWQRKAVADGFRKIKAVSDKKGYRVSPLIVAYMAANKGEAKVPGQDEERK